MAIVLIQQMPGIPEDLITEVSALMNVHEDPPAGLLIHTAIAEADGIKVIDVWDSPESLEAFGQERLRPALQQVMGRRGMSMDGPPPSKEVLEVFDLVRGRA